MTLAFTAVTSKNDVTLCNLDINVKNRMAAVVASTSLNLSRNSLTDNFYFIASSSLKIIKCGKSKGMQDKNSAKCGVSPACPFS